MKKILRFFDKLEDRVRIRLSHRSIFYALVGGSLVVLFWRGIWHSADILMEKGAEMYMYNGSLFGKILYYVFYEPNTIVWTALLLLLTGLFVATMIGDRIILSGLKHEKKVEEKTEVEVRQEEEQIVLLNKKVAQISKDIEEIKIFLKK
ncbi:MAG: hypothetical protein WC229_02000 [Candidatus Paceibacterota bacterium]|jgi:hypothetical protein